MIHSRRTRRLLAPLCLVLTVACDGKDDGAAKSDEAAAAPTAEAAATGEAAETAKSEAEATPTPTPPSEKLNLNTATKEQFLTIPDVGQRMAHEFDEYRPYVSIAQFRKEIAKYVDAEQVTAFEKYVFVPIDPNESDAATIAQIPGIDESQADAIVKARPYSDPIMFLDKVGELGGEEAKTSAAKMLAASK